MKLEFEPNIASSPSVENNVVGNLVNGNKSPEVTQMLRDGIKAAQSGNRAEARLMLLRVTEADSENENAWMWLASISEYPEELLVFLNNVLKINPENERAVKWLNSTKSLMAKTFVKRGITSAKENKKDAARQYFMQAIFHNKRNELAWFWLASVTESPEERISHLQKVLDINPENENALSSMKNLQKKVSQNALSQARSAVSRGDSEKAHEIIDKVLRQSPDLEEVWILKSQLSKSFSGKILNLEKVLEINPDNVAAKAALASLKSLHSEKNNYQEPAGELTKAPTHQNEISEDLEFETRNNEEAVEYSEVGKSAFNDYEEYLRATQNLADDSENHESVDSFKQPQTPELIETATSFSNSKSDIHTSNSGHFQNSTSCPFCSEVNESQSFVCHGCNAILTLSDIEMVLAHESANQQVVGKSVEMLEAENEVSNLEGDELKLLGLGYFNLKDMRKGFTYLQEAVQANPDNVVLVSQVDALAIRLAEIEQQEEQKVPEQRCANILVVDDSPTVRKLISSKLEKCGHEVVCAVDGMDALEKISESIPDLILLDITMPRMDGYQVCKLIRGNEATQEVPVVMISGNDGFFDKVRGKMAGTTNYITKPFGPDTLMQAVNEYIT